MRQYPANVFIRALVNVGISRDVFDSAKCMAAVRLVKNGPCALYDPQNEAKVVRATS